MIFGAVPLHEAEGAILAHSHRLNGRTLKKGRILTARDLDDLRQASHESVICARIEPDDMLEDDAANLLAGAVCGANLSRAAAFTGRCNLFAETDGIVLYDPNRLDGFNQVDEAVTLGVVPPYQHVCKGQMVATLKIIPFALPSTVTRIAAAIARSGGSLIRVAPFGARVAGLVQSRLVGTKESVLDSTRTVTQARLEAIGSSLVHEVRCEHETARVGRGISQLREQGADLVLVSGASAVVDRRDVVPAAIEQAGGRILHFGMPVDPGNLMLIAAIDDIPVIGMPGCARSPRLNGFDWVLQRIAAGLDVRANDIMGMGAGGLLKDVSARPLPRARARRDAPAPARRPRIAGLLLAAGQSRRMGSRNKLLADVDGVPMIRRTAENLLASTARPVVVVTGHQATEAERVLDGLDVITVHNPSHATGLSSSLKAGLEKLSDDVNGVVVCLGDMPLVTNATINRLIAAYDPVEGRAICVPTWKGKRGNPVLWDRQFFEDMAELSGDVGARHLIGTHGELVVEVEMKDDGVMVDIDTPEALARVNGK